MRSRFPDLGLVGVEFLVHQASQRTDAALTGDVVLGELQRVAVALEDFRVVVQLFGDRVDQLVP